MRRLLHQLEAVGLHLGQAADGLGRRPDAVGVDPDPRFCAHHLPHSLHLSRIARDPDLQLEGPKAVLEPGGRVPGDGVGPSGRQRRIALDRLRLLSAEHLPRGNVRVLRREIDQRHLDGCARRPRQTGQERCRIDAIGPDGEADEARCAEFAELSHDLAKGGPAPQRHRNRLADSAPALLRSQLHEHHLATLEPSAGGDVAVPERQGVRRQVRVRDQHRSQAAIRSPADSSTLKAASSAPVPARAAFSDGPSVRVITAASGRRASGAAPSARSPQAGPSAAIRVTGTATKAAATKAA